MGRATHVPTARGCAAMAQVGLVLGAGGLVGHAYHAGTLRALADARLGRPAGRRHRGHVGRQRRRRAAPGRPPAGDLAARVLGRTADGRGGPGGGQRPAPATTLDSRRPVGRAAPSCRPQSCSLALVAALVAGPARPLHGGRHAGGHAAHDDDRRPHPSRLRRSALARRSRCGSAPCACATDGGRCSAATSTRHPTSPRRSRPRRPSPGYFTPVEIDGERYVDGGAHSPTNADLLGRPRPRHHRRRVADVDGAARPARRRPRPVAGGGTASCARRWRRPARVGVRVLVIEPTADDLDAMGHRQQRPRRHPHGRRSPARPQRSAASLLAGEPPLG